MFVRIMFFSNSTSNKNVISNKGQNKGLILSRLVIVNKDSRKVAYYINGKLTASFPCCIGNPYKSPTPNGSFKIINKQINRPYYKKGIPGGSSANPLGKYFMQLTTGGLALHCTNSPSSIGKAVSHGCLRLYTNDARWLYNNTSVGTRVIIGTGYNKNIASTYGYKIY